MDAWPPLRTPSAHLARYGRRSAPKGLAPYGCLGPSAYPQDAPAMPLCHLLGSVARLTPYGRCLAPCCLAPYGCLAPYAYAYGYDLCLCLGAMLMPMLMGYAYVIVWGPLAGIVYIYIYIYLYIYDIIHIYMLSSLGAEY